MSISELHNATKSTGFTEDFGKELQKEISNLNITQKRFAELIGVHDRALSRIIKENKCPMKVLVDIENLICKRWSGGKFQLVLNQLELSKQRLMDEIFSLKDNQIRDVVRLVTIFIRLNDDARIDNLYNFDFLDE
jgi:predicted transcriptional regulator